METVKINQSCAKYVRNRAKKERLESELVQAIDDIRQYRAEQKERTKEQTKRNVWRAA
jgi:hypothetical protein